MDDIRSLTNGELRERLDRFGIKHGPITKGTRKLYEKHLITCCQGETQDEVGTSPTPENEAPENEVDVDPDVNRTAAVEESKDSLIVGSRMFYGVCMEKEDREKSDKEWVFSSHGDAVKAMKGVQGARMKVFDTWQDAAAFSNSNLPPSTDFVKKVSEPSIPYRSPTPQQLVSFRKEIESGNIEAVENYVRENPKYLVSSVETPVILHEGSRYNAMHVAAKADQVVICQLIIDVLGDPGFWSMMFQDEVDIQANGDRSQRLLVYYVNSPDKSAGDTPLHIACKFGFTEVVKLLMSLPYLEAERKNNSGETAEQVICSRCTEKSTQRKKEIVDLLSAKYYIPLLRAEDESRNPIICPPIMMNEDPIPLDYAASPIEPKLHVKACAGPMSPDQAQAFFKKWSSPKRGDFLNDFSKGKERVGRDLANSFSVRWREHWPFLDCFADFSTKSGLQKLEEYFRVKLQSRKTASESRLLMTKKTLDCSRGYFSIQNEASADVKGILFGRTLKTNEQDSLAKNLLKDFDQPYKEPIDSHIGKKPLNSDVIRSDVEDLEQLFTGISLDEPIAKEKQCTSQHVDNFENEILENEILENERDCASMDTVPSVPKVSTNLTPPDSSLTPNGRHDQGASNVCDESSENLGAPGGRTSVDTPYRNILHTHNPFFIHRHFPSKLDIDVFRATEGVEIDATEYPLVHQWRQYLSSYSAEERCSWPSPFSPKYRSRLSKKPADESQLS